MSSLATWPQFSPPLVGKTHHHVKNSKDFAVEVKKIKVETGEDVRSYAVSAAKMIPSSLWEHPCPRRRRQTVGGVLEMHFFQFDDE